MKQVDGNRGLGPSGENHGIDKIQKTFPENGI